jgi:hypothetical protein
MDRLPPDVQRLIATCIDSVETMEILILLRRSPDSFWSGEAVAAQLGIKPEVAERKLGALTNAGLLARGFQSGAFRFAPSDDALRQTVDQLAETYANRRINVLNAIYSENLNRLRAFSDAFKLKKED